MKYFPTLCLAVCLFVNIFLLCREAEAADFGENITIYDGVSSGGGIWYSSGEDKEVEPGAAKGQAWDLEAFFLENNTLTILSGFDLMNGKDGFSSGDIFLDINRDADYGMGSYGGGENSLVQDTYGYDYVMDLNFDDMTYTAFTLPEDTAMLQVVTFAQNETANPWRYYSGGVELLEGDISYMPDLARADVAGFSGKTHYAARMTLDFLAAGTEFTSHFTMECGNDVVMGRGTTSPEPSTIIMLLSGIPLAGAFKLFFG